MRFFGGVPTRSEIPYEQGERYLPALSGEKMQYLAHAFNDNTIRFVLRYPGRVDAALLRRAVGEVVSRSEILHSSFFPEGREPFWRVNQVCAPEDYFALVEADDPESAALAWAVKPIAPEARAQLFCTVVRGGREDTLCIRLSHLCADGSDGKYLLTKIAQAYAMLLEKGSAEDLRIKSGRRDPEQVYDHMEKREIRALKHSPMTGIKSLVPLPEGGRAENCFLHAAVPSSVMAEARGRAKALNATANDLLLAACYCAYAGVPGVEPTLPMSVMSMMDLRRHCPGGDTEGLCNLSGSLPTKLEQGVEGGFLAVLAQLAAQTAALKADPYAGLMGMPLLHGAVRMFSLRHLLPVARRVYRNMALGLTNLGSIPLNELTLGGLRPVDGLFGGPLKKKPSVQVCAASFDGACALTIVGEYTWEDTVLLQAMLDRMVEEIRRFSENKN